MSDRHTPQVTSIFSLRLTRILVWGVLFFALVRINAGIAAVSGGVLLLMYSTKLWSLFAVQNLNLVLVADKTHLFPGESLSLTVKLENLKVLPVWVGIELPAPQYFSSEEMETLQGETRLLSFEKRIRHWSITAQRRGVSALGPAQLSAGDLLGLHQRSRSFQSEQEIVIFPRTGVLKPLEIPFREYFGIHPAKGPIEDPAWYAGTRDYSGDKPAKNIHWKASARLGILQEKLYEPTSHRKVLILLDVKGFQINIPSTGHEELKDAADTEGPWSAGEREQEFEGMLETAATLAGDLMESGASFAFLTNADLTGSQARILPVGRGPEHLGMLLEMLARTENNTRADIYALLHSIVHGDMGIVYCGAEADENAEKLISSSLCRRRRLFFIFSHASEKDGGFSGTTPGWNGFPAHLAGEVTHVP